MNVQNTASVYEELGWTSLPSKPNDELGQEDFLRLMTAQLQYQDPSKPMDPEKFLSQIAQFGMVRGVNELNENFMGLAATMVGNQALQAASLVGKDVLVPSNTGFLEEGGTLKGGVELPFDAANVSIRIEDENGVLVDQMALGSQPMGLSEFEWDGTNLDGEPMPSGNYTIKISAQGADGTQSMQSMVFANVSSVDFGSIGEPMSLNLRGLGRFYFEQVRQIS